MGDRVKKGFFSLVRRIPLVQREMEKERVKVKKTLEDDMNKHTSEMVVYSQLPKNGRSVEEVTKLAKEYLDLGILHNITISYIMKNVNFNTFR